MPVKLKKIIIAIALLGGVTNGMIEHYQYEKQKEDIANSDSVLLECIEPLAMWRCDSPLIRLYLYDLFKNKITFCRKWKELYVTDPGWEIYPDCSNEKVSEIIAYFEGFKNEKNN